MKEETMSDSAADSRIAVVGMAGRFPGARDVDELWRNLREGRESVRILSAEELAERGADPALAVDPQHVPAVAEMPAGREPPLEVGELRALPAGEQTERFLEALGEMGFLPPGAGEEQVRRLLRVYRSNLRAARAYAASAYDGPVVLLRAAEGSVHAETTAAAPALGWERLVTAPVTVRTVPGDHVTLLARENVPHLADLLRQIMEETACQTHLTS